MGLTLYNAKVKWSKKKESKNISPKKTKRSSSIVKLPSVKNNLLQHPNYMIGQVLGEGAYAKVRLAHRKEDQMKCVIKMYEKNKFKSQGKKQTLLKEIEVLKKVDHEGLIKLLQWYETANTFNLVMEYFTSQSLATFIKSNRPIKMDLLQKITKQIAQALFYLHQKGMAHRDIKPQNILIDQQHQIKLIDLGFAMRGDEQQVKIAGTPQFMCPQLINKKNYNPFKADIWAFGIMLYWLTLGYFPQDADQKKKKNLKYALKNNSIDYGIQLHFPIDMNPGLQYLLTKMLKSEPDERINAREILEDTWIKPKCLKSQIEKLRKSRKQF